MTSAPRDMINDEDVRRMAENLVAPNRFDEWFMQSLPVEEPQYVGDDGYVYEAAPEELDTIPVPTGCRAIRV